MIVAVILGILSVFVIIFTAIYLNKKNKIKRNIQKRKGKKKLNNLWGIDDIRNEVIVLNNKKTIIMRIGSIDYHLLSAKEQNALETNLVEIAKTIKYPMQFFSTTEFIDTTEVIKEIKKTITEKNNPKITQYGNEIINHLTQMMENRNLYVRKNYVLISCFGEYGKSRNELLSIYESLRFNLLNAKIALEILNRNEIIELLHREFNKNITTKLEDILKEGGLELYVRGNDRLKEDEKDKKEKKR